MMEDDHIKEEMVVGPTISRKAQPADLDKA